KLRLRGSRGVSPGHRRLMLFLRVLFWQDVIDHADRIRRDMTVCPGPLHDGVHTLAGAARSFSFFQPDWPQHVGAVGGCNYVELLRMSPGWSAFACLSVSVIFKPVSQPIKKQRMGMH